MKTRWIMVALALAFATPATAKKYGKQVRFAGIHPVPKGEGGGICYIEAPHVHIYAPNKLEYRVVDGDDNVFVGDPVAYGYDGPKHAYKGHHPVQVNVVAGVGQPTTTYCYINGPHFHSFEPPPGPEFKVVGNAYFYVGEPAPIYLEQRPSYIGINATYEPIVYTRPVIDVQPPELWIGVRPGFAVVAPAAVIVDDRPGRRVGQRGDVVVGGGAVVTGGVSVSVPMPSVSVGIGVNVGAPGVIVVPGGRGHGKFKNKKFKRRH